MNIVHPVLHVPSSWMKPSRIRQREKQYRVLKGFGTFTYAWNQFACTCGAVEWIHHLICLL